MSRAIDCKKCLHEKVCALWTEHEGQDASCFCLDGCDYFSPTLTPQNEPLTLEQIKSLYPFISECEDCSNCGYRTAYGHGFNYCPNCGALMDGKEDDHV